MKLLLPILAAAQAPPLLPEPAVAAIATELSGEAAKRNLEYLTRLHRVPNSRGFHAAAEHVAAKARAYGLQDVQILQFPADGKTMFGTLKSRLAWDADFAELWEIRGGKPTVRLASFDTMPITLADDSESADVTADLVDVGEGTSEKDYAGKDVKGKIVLAAQQPGAVAKLAVDKYGAAGIVSYALNQPQAWRGEDENLIRWGHLDSYSPTKTFGFMVSLKTARDLRARLAAGETIRMHAKVQAGRHVGNFDLVTGVIPGADPQLKRDEIVFSCHLDHQLPGANDNASGCVTILEIARTLAKLIAEGKLARPARTMRFVWPPEIEGTMMLLTSHPEMAAHFKAAIHLDMVGGGPATKAIFHVTRNPASLPSFVDAVAEAFGRFVNEQSAEYASTGKAAYPLVAPEGGKEALQADFADFTEGSDHQIYAEGSFRIPAIYLNDWPDRYIHTNMDGPQNIDPTKLKRAGFIAAASGYFLAGMKAEDASLTERQAYEHFAWLLKEIRTYGIRLVIPMTEKFDLIGLVKDPMKHFLRSLFESPGQFFALPANYRRLADIDVNELFRLVPGFSLESMAVDCIGCPAPPVYRRNPKLKGPMSGMGYDFLVDHMGEVRARSLGLVAKGGLLAPECLNFVNGTDGAGQIAEALYFFYGQGVYATGRQIYDDVLEYLRALESIGVVERVK